MCVCLMKPNIAPLHATLFSMQTIHTIQTLQSFTLTWVPLIILLIVIHILVYTVKFFRSEKTKEALRAWYKNKIWKGVGALVFFFLLWLLSGFLGSLMNISTGGSVPVPMITTSMSNTSVGSAGIAVPSLRYNPSPVYNQNPSIADTRSFEKMSYSASIKTRTVEDVARKVKLLIKGVGGRVDSSNISTNYASFSFVVPKSEFDDFEQQVRTYTKAKLYSQSVSSQNKLSEKQALERNQSETKGVITSLTTQQQKVKDTYTLDLSRINSQLAAEMSELKSVQAQLALATTTNELTNLLMQAQERNTNTINGLYTSRSNLTAKFKADMSNLGASITQQNNVLEDLAKTTENFLDDIETVQGYISISYVTYFELFTIFSPINPIVLVGLVLLLLYGFSMYKSSAKEKELMAL